MSGNYYAPVMLPQGATVTQLLAYHYDGDATHNLSVGLYGCTVSSSDVQTLVVASLDLAPGYSYAINDNIIDEEIDNQSTFYYSIVTFPARISISFHPIIAIIKSVVRDFF